jgi:hypothetical protein
MSQAYLQAVRTRLWSGLVRMQVPTVNPQGARVEEEGGRWGGRGGGLFTERLARFRQWRLFQEVFLLGVEACNMVVVEVCNMVVVEAALGLPFWYHLVLTFCINFLSGLIWCLFFVLMRQGEGAGTSLHSKISIHHRTIIWCLLVVLIR